MKQPFCVRPFLELNLHHDGNITPCCQLYDHSLGHIHNDTIEELWNCDKLKSLRREFLDGEVKTCRENIEKLGCHLWFRHLEKDIEKKVEQTEPVKKLDIRLNGKCNLRCIMCKVWEGPNHVYDNSSFWRDGPQKIFPFLKEIDLLGGEPLIQKDTYRLIEEVSKVNSDCLFNITTNAHWRLNKTIESSFDKIKINKLIVSIDSIFPDTFQMIRQDGDLKLLLTTLKDLKAYQKRSGNIKMIRLDFLIQKLNYQELPQFLKYCDVNQYSFGLQIMKNPRSLSIYNEDQEQLRKWYQSLKAIKFQSYRGKQLVELIDIVEELFIPQNSTLQFS